MVSTAIDVLKRQSETGAIGAAASPAEAFDLVILGGTGDLALRKLLPALFHRSMDGQLASSCRIIGASRTELATEQSAVPSAPPTPARACSTIRLKRERAPSSRGRRARA